MRNTGILLVTLFLLIGCSGIKVVSDMDSTVDFNRFKTFAFYGWAKNSDETINRFNRERIEKAVVREFKRRGVDVADKGQGDLLVCLHVVTKEKTQTVARTSYTGGGHGGYYGYGPGYRWGMGHSTTTFQDYDYTVGTLVVSVFDARKKELIWEASGTGTVDENPKNAEKEINEAVAKIMEAYPVGLPE